MSSPRFRRLRLSRPEGPASPPQRSLLGWFRTIPGIVAFVGAVLAAGFCAIYILINIGVMGKELDVTAVSPFEVAQGKEAGLIGVNLGLVSEVFLSQLGVPPQRIYHKPENDSRLTLAIPSSVKPGEYWVEVKWKASIPVAWTKTLVVSDPRLVVTGGPGTTITTCREGQPPIVFADLNWTSAQVQNAIARFIVEHGYGCTTEAIFGPPEPLWESLVGGNIHVLMESWLPNHKPWWDPAILEASVIPLGKSLDDNWQSAFVVPTYVVEQNPGLKTVQDLRKYWDLFATGQVSNKAVIQGCLASWACAEINRAQIQAYGLSDVLKIKVPASNDELFASLSRAYERGEPWLGYM